MLQGFVRQYRGVYSSHHHLRTLPAIGVTDMIGSQRQLGQDRDAHQIHFLIDVIRSKSFLDNGNRVARRGERRQKWKIDPL